MARLYVVFLFFNVWYVDGSNEKQHILHSNKNTECKYKARNQSILLRI